MTIPTLLADLPLTLDQLTVVLDEVFLVPPTGLFPEVPPPATVEELAARTRLAPAEVVTRLERIVRLSENIEITAEDLKALLDAPSSELPMLVDVREPWEFETAHIAGSILLRTVNVPALIEQMRKTKTVIAVCHHGVRSFSAAMYLRQNGVPHALSLAGGVEQWAIAIDPTMPRY